MIIQALAFYIFAAILVLSGLRVVTARNPVYSVLFLILSFFNAAGLFILLGAEFIAMLLVIVYVGAVAVLFLFVVMMLDISFTDVGEGVKKYAAVGSMLGLLLLGEFILLYSAWSTSPMAAQNREVPTPDVAEVTNTEALGHVLYTDYVLAFQLAGMVLFVAMIGAIVLTHRVRPGVKRQNIADQHARKSDDVLEVQKVVPGSGVQI